MSNIRVNVSTPDEIAVPDTGTLTHITQTTSVDSGINSYYLGVGIVTAILLVTILPIIIIRKRLIKNRSHGFSLYSRKKQLFAIVLLALGSFGITFSVLSAMESSTYISQAIDNGTSEDVLTVTAEDTNIDIVLDGDAVYASAKSTVKVTTGTDGGYLLKAYTTTPDLTLSTDSSKKISGLPSSGRNGLSENTWGISLTAPENQSSASWRALPSGEQNAMTVKRTYDRTPANDTTDVYFGVYTSPDLDTGTYVGTVNYVAIANVVMPDEDDWALLDTGKVVNSKMKTLAAGTSTTHSTKTSDIKAIRMSIELPDGFTPSETNTVSTSESTHPIYIFYDNTDDAGIMYFYSGDYPVIMNPDSEMLFRSNLALADISGVADWHASNVTNMRGLLVDSTISLTNIDALAKWDVHNVTNMEHIFSTNNSTSDEGYTSSLSDVSAISNWDTSSVTSMRSMFYNARSLTSLDVSSLNTSNVTNMAFMFYKTKALTTLDVSTFDTSKVTNMRGMFEMGESYAGNAAVTEIIGLSNFDTSNVTDMSLMFYGDGNTTFYDIGGWNVSKVESFNHMFCDNFKLESLDLSGWDVSSVKTIYNMFDDNYALTTIGDISKWNTESLIDAGGFLNGARSFVGDNGILDLSGWNTSNVKVIGEAFRATKLTTIDLSGWTFESMTNDSWEGAGVSSGIYYTYGNEDRKGFTETFLNTSNLATVYISQDGLDSYNAAVERGVSTNNMWKNSPISSFTVKPEQ